MNDVRVVAAGHAILDVGALAIAPGEHVAIVGPSGAGKSSLVGLLLGWHRPAAGTVTVDGAPLGLAELEALRRRTVWVDPTVQLWNRSLAANLGFGLPAPPADLAPAIERGRARGRRRAAAARARRRRSARRARCCRAARGSGCASAAACCGRVRRW